MKKTFFLIFFSTILASCSFITGGDETAEPEELTQEEIWAQELETLPNLVFIKQIEPILSRTEVQPESFSNCTLISRDNTSTWEYHANSQEPCLELGVIIDANGYLLDDRVITDFKAEEILGRQNEIQLEYEAELIDFDTNNSEDTSANEESTTETTIAEVTETTVVQSVETSVAPTVESEDLEEAPIPPSFYTTERLEMLREDPNLLDLNYNTEFEYFDAETDEFYTFDSSTCITEPRTEEEIQEFINNRPLDANGDRIPLTRQETLEIQRERSRITQDTFYERQEELRVQENETENLIYAHQFNETQYGSLDGIFATVNRQKTPRIYDYRCLLEYNRENTLRFSQLWEWTPPVTMINQERELTNRPTTMTTERNVAGFDTGRKLILSSWTGVGIEDLDEVLFLETLDPYTREITNSIDLRLNYKNWDFRFSEDNILAARNDLGEEIEEEDWIQVVITDSGLIANKRNFNRSIESANRTGSFVRIERLEDPLTLEIKAFGFPPEIEAEEPDINDAWWASETSAAFFETGDEFWGVIGGNLSQVSPRTGTQSEINELEVLNANSAISTSVSHAWINPEWISYRTSNSIIFIERGLNINEFLIDPNLGLNLGVPAELVAEDPDGIVREFLNLNNLIFSEEQIACNVENRLDLAVSSSSGTISNTIILILNECAPEVLAERSINGFAFPESISPEVQLCALTEIYRMQGELRTFALTVTNLQDLESNIRNECDISDEQPDAGAAMLVSYFDNTSPTQTGLVLDALEEDYPTLRTDFEERTGIFDGTSSNIAETPSLTTEEQTDETNQEENLVDE